MKRYNWENGYFSCSTDKSKLQLEIIHHYLSEKSYWAKGRSMKKIKTSIENSECFGIYNKEKQVGFARVVSDFAIYGYILDVFVLEDERGKRLGQMANALHYESSKTDGDPSLDAWHRRRTWPI